MAELNMDQIVAGFGVLAENQNRINAKIDSILEFLGGQVTTTNDMQQVINQQSYALNNLSEKINGLTSKMADIQIQLQNSSGDSDNIVSAMNDIVMQIDGVKRMIEQWKVYSEL